MLPSPHVILVTAREPAELVCVRQAMQCVNIAIIDASPYQLQEWFGVVVLHYECDEFVDASEYIVHSDRQVSHPCELCRGACSFGSHIIEDVLD
jgi:hypothetical protein